MLVELKLGDREASIWANPKDVMEVSNVDNPAPNCYVYVRSGNSWEVIGTAAEIAAKLNAAEANHA